MDKMTPRERVIFSHGKERADLEMFNAIIESANHDIRLDRLVWLAAVALATVAVVIGFVRHGVMDSHDIELIVVIALAFIVPRIVSYLTINRLKWLVNLERVAYNRLVNDVSLKFGFEELQQDEKDAKGDAKPDSK